MELKEVREFVMAIHHFASIFRMFVEIAQSAVVDAEVTSNFAVM